MYNFGDKHFDPILWDEKLLPFEKALYLDFLQSKIEESAGNRDVGAAPTIEDF